MSTKEKLLALLEQKKGQYLSGEELAQALSVSRTAIWKAMKSLRTDGYEIDAVQNRGYCLAELTDILSADGIRSLLKHPQSYRLELIPTVESTNTLMRQRANEGAPEGTVILACTQTRGRGRMGRDFYSPSETGIYMSLLLRPEHFSPAQAVHITTMAAVAVCDAIECVTDRRAEIKWVNDIYMDGRKVSGILTEGAYDLESGSMEYIVLGIGINAYPPQSGFPQELQSVAGAVFSDSCYGGRNRITAAFLNAFDDCYRGEGSKTYAEKYRSRSFVIGREVDVLVPGGMRRATALDLDNECRLIVRYEDGTVETLSSAEVSVRPLKQ